MNTIEKTIAFPDTYPLERIGRLEDMLFFDIETTGFSGEYSHLYLIGCTFYRNKCWNLIQWFADTIDAEEELLHNFFCFLRQFRILIHFNGDGFDIPYLKKRCSHFDLPYDFSSLTSIDIYRRIKPYRKLLGLDSLKQKAIEHFLGISRTDTYSGGELIQVYEDYLHTHSENLYDLLLLHNEDDLKGMPSILPILSYPDFFGHSFRLTRQSLRQEQDESGNPLDLLDLFCESDYSVPVSFQAKCFPVQCSVYQNNLTLSIELFKGTLKHFYPNYKDYYYLPWEDTAIHKSIGEYVDKNARQKATAKTCYTKKEGCFLPQITPIWEPVMKYDPKDKLSYASLDQIDFADPKRFCLYISQMLTHLCTGK
ncbi:MAG: ribonuclease H-like domain-containing protein [Lachnospiraceae bacterium]|jgi:uncharacterized protein YprB with RNaseH-like and TPR domain|nr:ribonuclease H-like domain-containing protein [Lachnospiraceae bacterium]